MPVVKLPGILSSKPPIYDLYCPDSKGSKKSITFFEDDGITTDLIDRDYTTYTAKLNLICWYNLKQINPVPQKSAMIQSIIQILNGKQHNNGIFTGIFVECKGEKITASDIFSRYDIDIAMTQYLMYPYDAFCIPLEVSFQIGKDCLVPLEIDPIECFENDITCI